MTVEVNTWPITDPSHLMARMQRTRNFGNALMAPKAARPGESHAAARARLLAMQQEMERKMEWAFLYGEPS